MDVTPQRIMQIAWAHVPQRALTSAVDLGFFTQLDHGCRTAAEVAAAAGASERGTRMVLDVLAALGLVTKSDGEYANTPETATFLVRGKPTYLGGLVQHTNQLWDNYRHTTEAVTTGRPPVAVNTQDDGEEFFVELVPQIFGNSYAQARAGAAALGIGETWTGAVVLDIGAGSGAWSLACLERDPTARAIAVDYPHVLAVTRQFAAKFGCAERYEYREGNFRDVDFGTASCDLAILGHICHSEGEAHTKRLFHRIHTALRPGGKLLIGDMIPDEDRCTETFPLLFAINMLVHTDEGDCFTLSEYTAWLQEAGFGEVVTIPNPGPSPLLVASR